MATVGFKGLIKLSVLYDGIFMTSLGSQQEYFGNGQEAAMVCHF